MKTKRLILALTTWTVVIVMSLHSCQTDSGYDNVIQENNLTEADLFVASEAYKNLEKEIKKNLRRRKNAIDKLSKEEKKQYQQLRKELSKSDTRVEAQIQLNILLGYDEEASYDRIDSLVWLCRSAALPPLSPLRTVRASFPAYSSDNSKFSSHKPKSAHPLLMMGEFPIKFPFGPYASGCLLVSA